MEIALISLAAFLVSLLTFFSGFGLGTIMLPVFALFFPLEIAIALTGIVHFANNLFKAALIGKNTDIDVLLRFGIPAVIASFAGAWFLARLSGLPAIASYDFIGKTAVVTPVKIIIGVLLLIFSILEIVPAAKKMQFSRSKLPLGGILSGFFGGLSGIQGAIRSAFLVKSGLSKEAYLATGVLIACLVDITRLSVYITRFRTSGLSESIPLMASAIIAAVAGAYIGSRLLKKVTLNFIQSLVAALLIIVSISLCAGII
jgi:uncharacterized membrane protein YfcA